MATAHIHVDFPAAKMAQFIEAGMAEHIDGMVEPLTEYQRGFADALRQIAVILRNAESEVEKRVNLS